MKTIQHAGEFWRMHENGRIERPGLVAGSDTWRVTGAVTLNNFGHVTRRYSLAEVEAGGIVWKHANGKQRTFILDSDHGTARMWTCNHSIN